VGTVVVTGGAGFIGSNLADALLAAGHAVHIIDNLSTGSRKKLPAAAAFHELDIRDADRLGTLIQSIQPETVFHLAAQADVRKAIEHPDLDAAVNVIGTINVLEAARRVDSRVVFTSTGGAAYGEYPGLPIPTPETAEARPMSQYGAGKLAGEGYCLLYHRLYGLPVVVLRLGNVYGPRQDPHGEAGVVSIFAGRLLDGAAPRVFGDGTQTRDYVFVGDVVRAFLAAQTSGDGEIFNIGCGREVSVLDLLHELDAALAPVFAPARPGELQRSALANVRAREALGWTPTVPLTEGLRVTRDAIAVTHRDPTASPPGVIQMMPG
jgi:UDP-glucose 4-epimerase